MRLRTFKKYGLEYFEPIVKSLKKNEKYNVNREEFELKMIMAKQKILDVYSNQKSKQTSYNNNWRNNISININNVNQQEQNSQQVQNSAGQQTIQIPEVNQQFQPFQSFQQQQQFRIVCSHQSIQTDNEYERKLEKQLDESQRLVDKGKQIQEKFKTSELQYKQQISRLEMDKDKKTKDNEQYKKKSEDYKKKSEDYKKKYEDLKASYNELKSEYYNQQDLLKQSDQNLQKQQEQNMLDRKKQTEVLITVAQNGCTPNRKQELELRHFYEMTFKEKFPQ